MLSGDMSGGDLITMGPNAGTIYDGRFGTVDQATLLGLQGQGLLTDPHSTIFDSDTPHSFADVRGSGGGGTTLSSSLFFLVLVLGALVFIGMIARHMWLIWTAKDKRNGSPPV